jgi:hypothetical protein
MLAAPELLWHPTTCRRASLIRRLGSRPKTKTRGVGRIVLVARHARAFFVFAKGMERANSTGRTRSWVPPRKRVFLDCPHDVDSRRFGIKGWIVASSPQRVRPSSRWRCEAPRSATRPPPSRSPSELGAAAPLLSPRGDKKQQRERACSTPPTIRTDDATRGHRHHGRRRQYGWANHVAATTVGLVPNAIHQSLSSARHLVVAALAYHHSLALPNGPRHDQGPRDGVIRSKLRRDGLSRAALGQRWAGFSTQNQKRPPRRYHTEAVHRRSDGHAADSLHCGP